MLNRRKRFRLKKKKRIQVTRAKFCDKGYIVVVVVAVVAATVAVSTWFLGSNYFSKFILHIGYAKI